MYIEDLDLKGLIADQPRLRLLGLWSETDDDEVLAQRTKQLLEISSCRLTVFVLHGFTWDTHSYTARTYHKITLLPLSHRPGKALQECRNILTLISKYHKRQYVRHLSFKLLGATEENISLLEEVMEAMATCLQDYGECCEYVEISTCDTTMQVSFPLSRCLPKVYHPIAEAVAVPWID